MIVDPTLSHAPPVLNISEDHALVFSSAGHNGISVSDADSVELSVTLTVQHGTVTLASLDDLSVTGGQDGSATVTISGSAAAINTALEGLGYQPDLNYNGSDALVVTVSDGSLDDTRTINLMVDPVNDAPEFGANGASTFLQDGNGVAVVVAPDVSVFDADNANFSGGMFTAEITGGLHDGDQLSIWNDDFISVSGTTVSYDADGTGSGGSVEVGTRSGSRLQPDGDAERQRATAQRLRLWPRQSASRRRIRPWSTAR